MPRQGGAFGLGYSGMGNLSMDQKVPLSADAEGVLRITGSRVTLDSIIHQFRTGATAEQIQEDFPSVTLADIYAVIAYYLQHSQEVEKYFVEQSQRSSDTRQELEGKLKTDGVRQMLKQRRAQASG